MIKAIKSHVCFIILLCFAFSVQSQSPGRTMIDFDPNWKFIKADATGAEQLKFNDAAWRSLNVPHDWSIEGPYDRGNTTGRGGGYLPDGVGWYRKTFSLNEADKNKKVFIEFDGVMANSDVWINGFHLGKRPNGYVSFQYELTPHLNYGTQKNIIAVRADNTTQPASRWYTGAGIYRHVKLITADPVHVAYTGSYLSATDVSAQKATVQVQTEVNNTSSSAQNISLQINILDPSGKQVATASSSSQKINQNNNGTVSQKIEVTNPALWDIDKPQLYKAITKVFVDKKQVDEVVTPFGIRDAHFDAATGFWLNGKNIKIKGVCLHHDAGALGSAVPLNAWKRRLQQLKEVGVNGIRTSHNEVAPEFLDLCDQLGLVVMDETFDTWNAKKSNAENGYNLYFTDWWERDTRNLVMRDRNHPSIVIYSVGNEIHDNLNDSSGFQKYRMQQNLIHQLDPTRPVTMALFRPALSHVYENGLADMMDVIGQNYRENEIIAAHQANPKRKVIGTENRHEQAAWIALRDQPFIAGQFLWTGFDYLGEADWPKIANASGLYDKTGELRTIGYQRQSWWSDKPMLYITRKEGNAGAGDWVSDWSPTDVDTYDEARIQVFSNCDEVELFLNGKSIGVKQRPADNASPLNWTVTFQRGTLKAMGRNNGKLVAEQELTTAGKASKIQLRVDKNSVSNNWNDLVYVMATITDDNGNPILTADNKIKFSVSGPGVIAAVDNGDPASTEPYQAKERWAYKGKCIAIIKANADAGKIIVTANADGLTAGTINIDATK